MSDISSQLIKDSYNYVLQSDLNTGVVYRIGGGIPINPIFQSGLTINSGFTYSNGSEQSGYVLTSDDFGNATWGPISGSSSGSFLPLSGGTVTGPTIFTGGLTANTISATTYFNLPKDVFVTGGTYNNGSATFTNNTGGTFTVTGFSTSTGTSFTGGTVSGATNFTDGLSANTISATTYQNLPQDIFVTGGTYTSGNAIFTNNSGGTFTVTGFAVGGGGGQTFYLNLSQSQGGNRLLSTTASTASEQTSGVTISNGVTSTIASFQSQPLNITLLPGGIWGFYLHSYKENNNASFNIFVEVYKRTSGGTQTLLFTTDPAPVTTNSPNPSMQLSDGYFSGTPLSVSDSIVAVVRATNTSNQSHIITLVTEGSQHYSYAVSTIPTQQGLTCDTLSGCSIIQTIQTDVSNKLDKSGGTITGDLIINSGLTANTISATTYLNLPLTSLSGLSDVSITSVSSGDTLVYSGSSWVNAPLSEITGEYNVKITTPSSIVSGTTSETQLLKLEIPPYSFAANDVLNIPTLIISKVGTGASYTLRVKLSELSTMPVGTGTQTIAFMSIGNTNIFTKLSRNFIINGGFLKGYPLSNNASDVANSTSSLREQAFNHTITNYLYVSVNPAFAGDTFQLIGLQINNL